MKSLEFYKNYITLFCLEKINFLKYYINSESCIAYYPDSASTIFTAGALKAQGYTLHKPTVRDGHDNFESIYFAYIVLRQYDFILF